MHVLSLPPAFVLSQDQTLRLNEISSGTGHASLDEVTQHGHGADEEKAETLPSPASGCFLEKRVPPISSTRRRSLGARRRPAVHASLPSNQIVKEPTAETVPRRSKQGSQEPPRTENPTAPKRLRPPPEGPDIQPRTVEKTKRPSRSQVRPAVGGADIGAPNPPVNALPKHSPEPKDQGRNPGNRPPAEPAPEPPPKRRKNRKPLSGNQGQSHQAPPKVNAI